LTQAVENYLYALSSKDWKISNFVTIKINHNYQLKPTRFMRKLITQVAMAVALLISWGGTEVSAQPFCNQAQSTPGFASNPQCQVAVCNLDPFCCDNVWDGICANEAAMMPVCNSCGLFCNVPQGGPGFSGSLACQTVICADDPFCCDTSWDGVCAESASFYPECLDCLGLIGCDDPAASNYVAGAVQVIDCEYIFCDEAQPGAGFPSNSACATAVCLDDPFCCNTVWDSQCAGSAMFYVDCQSCLTPVVGCMNPLAINFDPSATVDSGCIYFVDLCCNSLGDALCPLTNCANDVCLIDLFCCSTSWDSICASEALEFPSCGCPIQGCTNPLATNYNPDAVVDDGSCDFDQYICCEAIAGGFACPFSDCEADVCAIDPFCCDNSWDGICAQEAIITPSCNCSPGCTNPLATNYNPAAVYDDGSCDFDQYICCEAIAGGFACPFSDCEADVCAIDPFCCDNSWDGICAQEAIITPSCNCSPGCTNPLATNYNPAAVYDDGSCEFAPNVCCEALSEGTICPISGCAEAVCVDDPFCCETEWDGFCAAAAQDIPECSCGPITSVNEITSNQAFNLFPNPNTGGFVNIELNGMGEGNHDVMIMVFSVSGKLVNQQAFGHTGKQLNRLISFNNALSTGLYFVNVSVDGQPFATSKLVVR